MKQHLPVNWWRFNGGDKPMPWWGWIVVGGVLLAAEMFMIDAEFYLIFIGFSALLVGVLGLAGLSMPVWAQWLLFAGLSLTLMFIFRKKFYDKLRGGIPDMPDTMTGQRVLIPEDLAPNTEMRVSYRGSEWTVVNAGTRVIAAGSRVDIDEVSGLTLRVGANQ